MTGRIFPSADGEAFLDSTAMSYAWRSACRNAGVKGARFHDLRAAHASWLIDMGGSVADVQKRLGHASAATTLKFYTKVAAGKDRTLADLLDQA